MSEYLKQQIEGRQSAWHAAKSLLDAAAAEKRDLSAEEDQSYQRMMADIDTRSERIADLMKAEERAANIEAAMANAPEVRAETRAPEQATLSDADILRKMVSGEIRRYEFTRALSTGGSTTGQKLVPTGFYDQIIENLQYTGPWPTRGMYTVLNTDAGNTLKIPTETARPTGTATAEGATFNPSDPNYSELSLSAFKFGTLVVASNELLADSGIDLESFLAKQIGVALGTAVNNVLANGTGTVQPSGVVVGAGSGVTGGTGVVGVPTADNLIDLVHSVDSLYASRPSAAFQARRATIGAIRKLKDSAGYYLFQPSSSIGTPDTLYGYALVENPYIPATATNAKSVLFGAMDYFYVRQVGGIEVVRSDEAYFTSDQVAWRATVRIDSGLGNSAAIKYFAGGTA